MGLAAIDASGLGRLFGTQGLENDRVLAVDASELRSGCSRFSKSWRPHFALDIFTLTSHEFKITENETGETLTNFTAAKGDLFLADRGYASKKSLSHCLGHGADCILRLRYDGFAMYSSNGERIDLDSVVTKLCYSIYIFE